MFLFEVQQTLQDTSFNLGNIQLLLALDSLPQTCSDQSIIVTFSTMIEEPDGLGVGPGRSDLGFVGGPGLCFPQLGIGPWHFSFFRHLGVV